MMIFIILSENGKMDFFKTQLAKNQNQKNIALLKKSLRNHPMRASGVDFFMHEFDNSMFSQFINFSSKNWFLQNSPQEGVQIKKILISSKNRYGITPWEPQELIFSCMNSTIPFFWRKLKNWKIEKKMELSNSWMKKSTPEALMGWFRDDFSRRSIFF